MDGGVQYYDRDPLWRVARLDCAIAQRMLGCRFATLRFAASIFESFKPVHRSIAIKAVRNAMHAHLRQDHARSRICDRITHEVGKSRACSIETNSNETQATASCAMHAELSDNRTMATHSRSEEAKNCKSRNYNSGAHSRRQMDDARVYAGAGVNNGEASESPLSSFFFLSSFLGSAAGSSGFSAIPSTHTHSQSAASSHLR